MQLGLGYVPAQPLVWRMKKLAPWRKTISHALRAERGFRRGACEMIRSGSIARYAAPLFTHWQAREPSPGR
ncbi:hypothetical protein SPHI_06470 [Sphingomonas jeddahensis]|uniref:Uncharacterized protein n=1 Tax=Sphingomonas jeddahensis TaxID=1915074 RepID=A0A1V2EX85_9SPHN|nr:hypothetical protein SPHI_06470 [Sphingomonas jeddahensis]